MRVVLLLAGLGLIGVGLYVAIRLPALPGESHLRWWHLELHSTSVGVTFVIIGVACLIAAVLVPGPASPADPGGASERSAPTVVVTRTTEVTIPPVESGSTPSATSSPSETVTPPATASPTTTPRSTPKPLPPPPGIPEGTELARYALDLPSGYVIQRFSAQRHRPTQDYPPGDFDLWWSGLTSTFRSVEQLSLLDKANPTYRDCNENTAYRDFIGAAAEGQTICFTGHGVVAAATISEPVSESASYVSLNIAVWQGP